MLYDQADGVYVRSVVRSLRMRRRSDAASRQPTAESLPAPTVDEQNTK